MTKDQVDQIIFAVERRVGALPGTCRRKDRLKETLRVRKVVFYVLFQAGMSQTAISREFEQDGSTVSNLLERAEQDLERGETWWEETRYIAARALMGGKKVVFNFRLERAITGLPPVDQRAVVLYANGPLLGWERNDPQQEAYGLTVVARDPRARHALEQALVVAELGEHVARVDMQARSLERRGYVDARS